MDDSDTILAALQPLVPDERPDVDRHLDAAILPVLHRHLYQERPELPSHNHKPLNIFIFIETTGSLLH